MSLLGLKSKKVKQENVTGSEFVEYLAFQTPG
jgi:hypothetical protein